ncbi:malonyl-CoA synthase [Simiduia curdlanivorans]|uniref:Malonyl-CoA synthase n=1 Tax=Simiduia curdlanivorans TaxID=1492769 RepID=A0ABV8V7K7_9GAMM|nr:malonyl-CoA synthase [Simiduia curdlanivorans]MDN3638817.1 malonyl-CoA synthase [Simiduia curdlanivorans]
MTDNANLYAHFQQHFPTDKSTRLLCTPEGRTVSYGEAEQASARIANSLLKLGAKAGDRVTVQVTKSVENLFLYLACLRAGLVYHPLNTAYTTAELSYFLTNAEPTLIVCDSQATDLLSAVMPTECVKALLTLDADGSGSLMEGAANESSSADIAQRIGTDMAALLYSSGTTGKPKGIMLSHDNLRKNAQTLVQAWGFSAADHLLHMLPIYHVHGLFVALSCVLMSGASMAWHSGFRDQAAVTALPDCTVMMGVPTYYTRLLNNPAFGSQSCKSIRLFTSGSAPLLAETFVEFQSRTGHAILERYGMTETGMNTSNPLNGERRAGTVGPALPGVTVRIVDDTGQTLSNGDIGNIQVQGANVFSGYWRMPEKTAEDFTADGFFNTGDKGVIDTDGYLSIVGRAKDLIICGGLNVYPKEIELVIDDMPGVLESAVIGVPHADFGEAVLAVIVADGQAPSAEHIIQHCKTQLANFKVPKRVEFVATLPRNAMGKVQKNILREQFAT